MSLYERFKAKVRKTKTCWLWTGGTVGGYGVIGRGKRGTGLVSAHRYAYYLAHGKWPKICRHTCDNPRCVRATHLVDGDHSANLKDAYDRGQRKQRRKLTDRQRSIIRLAKCSQRFLAQQYGVSQALISRIKNEC